MSICSTPSSLLSMDSAQWPGRKDPPPNLPMAWHHNLPMGFLVYVINPLQHIYFPKFFNPALYSLPWQFRLSNFASYEPVFNLSGTSQTASLHYPLRSLPGESKSHVLRECHKLSPVQSHILATLISILKIQSWFLAKDVGKFLQLRAKGYILSLTYQKVGMLKRSFLPGGDRTLWCHPTQGAS